MLKNLTISEIEAAATYRMLVDRLFGVSHVMRDEFDLSELLTQSVYAVNDILREYGLNNELWVRVRGNKALLFFNLSRRVMAEVAVDAEKEANGLYRRPRIIFLGRDGYLKQRSVAELIMLADKLNKRYEERENNGRYQGKTKRNWSSNHKAIRH